MIKKPIAYQKCFPEYLFSILFYLVCGAVLLYLIFPIFIVIPISFSSSMFLKFPPPGFSFQWYAKYLTSHEWVRATWTSLEVAGITTVTATILGTLLAFGLARGKLPGTGLLFSLIVSPMVVPVIIIAVSFYFFYAKLQLIGTVFGLVAAHTILATPFVLILVGASLKGFDETLEWASLSLGAKPLKTFLFVVLPGIRPGIISGALFAFITSFDELVIAIFVCGTRAVTLPKRMWDGIRIEIDPTIAAISSILIGVAVLLMVVTQILQRRK
jgi:putative spermidine/putrescine transport system permease protein